MEILCFVGLLALTQQWKQKKLRTLENAKANILGQKFGEKKTVKGTKMSIVLW